MVSLALHALLLAALVAHGEHVWSRAPGPENSPFSGGASGGGGGGGPRVAYITLPSPPEAEKPAPQRGTPPVPTPPPVLPRPVRQPEPPKVAPSEVDTTKGRQPSVAVRDSGVGQGGGPVGGTSGKPGSGEGQGNQGAGAGSGAGGEGGRARPPEPRDMAFPFDNPPKELRGLSLNVTFWVQNDGRVERYRVEPEIKDRDYAKKFDEVMRAFRFTPARAPDGTSIPGTTTISFTLPGKSSS